VAIPLYQNPFRPGAGHPPPYLAGREDEKAEFSALLNQSPVMSNLVLTGLRGVGKTVLLETFKPIALKAGWMWAGTDLSETASVSEDNLAIRILADLAPLVSGVVVQEVEHRRLGFRAESEKVAIRLDFDLLRRVYDTTPGLSADKLKAVLELVWSCLTSTACRGIVLAYDEAQNLSDQAEAGQYPLSLLLDVFQSVQKKGLPLLLVLTGLPTLFPKLVETRTFAERMFRVVTLGRLTDAECREAITVPMRKKPGPAVLPEAAIEAVIRQSGGYPYFVQFFCRELFDAYLQQQLASTVDPEITVAQIVRKLDSDFFAGRWNRVTDRQRDLLTVIAQLENCDEEFSVARIVARSRKSGSKPFGSSQVNQILAALGDSGLVYKNRYGRYAFALPLLGEFIRRQEASTR